MLIVLSKHCCARPEWMENIKWYPVDMESIHANEYMNAPHRNYTPTWQTRETPIRYEPTRRDFPFANPTYLAKSDQYKCYDECELKTDLNDRADCLAQCRKLSVLY